MFLPFIAAWHFKKWNSEEISLDELFQFCENNRVWVLFVLGQGHGRYLRYKDCDFILLNPKLPRMMLWWVLAHEVAHFLLHTPHNFNVQATRKADYEANFIAAPMLLPQRIVRTRSIQELIEDGYPPELVIIRRSMSEFHRL